MPVRSIPRADTDGGACRRAQAVCRASGYRRTGTAIASICSVWFAMSAASAQAVPDGDLSPVPAQAAVRLPPACGSYDGQAIEDRTITLPATTAEQEVEVEVGSVMLTTVAATIAEASLTLDKDASFTGTYFGAAFVVTLPAGPVGARLFPGPGYAVPQATFRYDREHGDRHGFSKPDVSVASSRDGKTLTTDGPFADTKEVLGGLYLLDANDLDAAVAFAEQIPDAANGSIEVRPIVER